MRLLRLAAILRRGWSGRNNIVGDGRGPSLFMSLCATKYFSNPDPMQ
jgi:hypothetical protein